MSNPEQDHDADWLDSSDIDGLCFKTRVPRTGSMRRLLRRDMLSPRSIKRFMRLQVSADILTNWHRNANEYLHLPTGIRIAGTATEGPLYVMQERLSLLDNFDNLAEVDNGRLSADGLGAIAKYEIGRRAQDGPTTPPIDRTLRESGPAAVDALLDSYDYAIVLALMKTVNGPFSPSWGNL